MKVLIVLCLLLGGCTSTHYTNAEWIAGRRWLWGLSNDCKSEVEYMGRCLNEPYYICHGTYNGKPHRWIELVDGTKVDSCVSGNGYYEEIWRE